MKYISLIFLFAILFSLFARLEVCISYLFNQTYYAEILCENKDEEDSCCKGKCAMGKELLKLTEKEEPQPTKNSTTAFKITKSDEAVMSFMKFIPSTTFHYLGNSYFVAKLKIGVSSTLYKPPIV